MDKLPNPLGFTSQKALSNWVRAFCTPHAETPKPAVKKPAKLRGKDAPATSSEELPKS